VTTVESNGKIARPVVVNIAKPVVRRDWATRLSLWVSRRAGDREESSWKFTDEADDTGSVANMFGGVRTYIVDRVRPVEAIARGILISISTKFKAGSLFETDKSGIAERLIAPITTFEMNARKMERLKSNLLLPNTTTNY
jgi:hypothetical protein